MRSNISDDYDKAILENKILVRLKVLNHPNIVKQIDFFADPSMQTTLLVMEALNGMTLLETLYDESAFDHEIENIQWTRGRKILKRRPKTLLKVLESTMKILKSACKFTKIQLSRPEFRA